MMSFPHLPIFVEVLLLEKVSEGRNRGRQFNVRLGLGRFFFHERVSGMRENATQVLNSKKWSFKYRANHQVREELLLTWNYELHEVAWFCLLAQWRDNATLDKLFWPTLYIPFQYIIYDINAFIADVGGYLGLLLGQSIYGLYEIITHWLGYRITKCGNTQSEKCGHGGFSKWVH